MALVLKDRVKQYSVTNGTGAITFDSSSVTGYQTFASAIGVGNTTYYAIYHENTTEWEVGLGTVSASGISRDSVLASSNSGAKVNFTDGNKAIWCDYPASKAVYLDPNGNVTNITGYISKPDYIEFDTTYATTLGVGQLGWDGNNTLGLGMAGGNVTQRIGEDQFYYVKASSAITKGQVCMFTGAVGASGVLTAAPASGSIDGLYIMGIAAESIANNGFGLIQCFGTLRGIDTSAYTDGAILYYDPTVTGAFTSTTPAKGKTQVVVAAVANANNNGTLAIRITYLPEFGDLANVSIVSPTTGQQLIYNSVTGVWSNANNPVISGGTIDNTPIGATTASTGAFTTATASTQARVATSWDKGTGVLQVTGNSAFDGTVSDKQLAMVGGNNLLTYSEQFDNAAWTKNNSTISANATTAPDGTVTADKLVESVSASSHNITKTNTAITANIVNTFSVYIKAAERTKGRLFVTNGPSTNGFSCSFDLTAVTVTALGNSGTGTMAGSPSITSVGNGWFRLSISGTIDSSSTTGGAYIYLYDAAGNVTYTGDGTSGFYIWGAQLEASNIASPYTQTVASAVSTINDIYLPNGAVRNLPWNQGTGSLQITGNTSVNGNSVNKNVVLAGGNNLLTYSQDQTNAIWTKNGGGTITGNATTAPDGTVTAGKFVPTAGSTGATVGQTATLTSGTTYTFSFYAKQAEQSTISLVSNIVTAYRVSVWNLATGVVSTTATGWTATIASVGNGWYRCTATATATGTSADFQISNNTAGWTGNGTNGVYIWGAQLETGTVASAYTATTTTAVSATNQVLNADGVTATPSYSFANATGTGMFRTGGGSIGFSIAGTNRANITSGGTSVLGYLDIGGSTDVLLNRDAAGTLAQRNSTNAQTYNLYNTYTDASNYERLAVTWSSNTLLMNAQAAGTGTVRNLGLQTGGGNVGIGTNSPSQKLHIIGTTKTYVEGTTIGSSNAGLVSSRTVDDSLLYLGYRTTPDAWVIGATYQSTGAYKPILLATADTERVRIDTAGNVGIGATANVNTKLDVAGTIRAKGYTVATLPTGVVGAMAYVTDALAPAWNTAVVGGGAITVPVFYNGTAWVAM